MIVLRAEPSNHYHWGSTCNGWRLVAHDALTVTEETMPARTHEVEHFHWRARHVFYVLHGHATIVLSGGSVHLGVGEAVDVAPGERHQIRNDASEPLHFLLISAPSTASDRREVTP